MTGHLLLAFFFLQLLHFLFDIMPKQKNTAKTNTILMLFTLFANAPNVPRVKLFHAG
ncbi:hypothetical protein MgSA37_02964 [Mucilaginibacter gotjawali]|uniref:Uncharacterized protein n=2 Tax=Mucilaginibacter gotjawali TaxID=1550579 RepID=A0A0X8X308_9SPHI|nr:O-antigen/teichoic acid export membrane protein [Mucilaginibacter gotjawali]BAU54786.1 hypothetical protein MgSA37_02964 [Mucilaginibacter gotjawali]